MEETGSILRRMQALKVADASNGRDRDSTDTVHVTIHDNSSCDLLHFRTFDYGLILLIWNKFNTRLALSDCRLHSSNKHGAQLGDCNPGETQDTYKRMYRVSEYHIKSNPDQSDAKSKIIGGRERKGEWSG